MVAPPPVSLRVVTLAPEPVPASRPMSYVVVLVHWTKIVDVGDEHALAAAEAQGPGAVDQALGYDCHVDSERRRGRGCVGDAAHECEPDSPDSNAWNDRFTHTTPLVSIGCADAAVTVRSTGRYSGKVNC